MDPFYNEYTYVSISNDDCAITEYGLAELNENQVAASTNYSTDPPKSAIDRNPNTIWHSDWAGADPPNHPHLFTITFDTTQTITGFAYLTRQDDGWPNGNITGFSINIDDGAHGEGNFNDKLYDNGIIYEKTLNGYKYKFVVFNEQINVNSFQLETNSSLGGSGIWASIADLRLFTNTDGLQDPSNVLENKFVNLPNEKKTDRDSSNYIIAKVERANPTANDWVGLYNTSDVPGNVDSIAWGYVSSDGTATLDSNPNISGGEYVLILLQDNSYTELARIPVTIV